MKVGLTGDLMFHGTGILLTMDLTEILWVRITQYYMNSSDQGLGYLSTRASHNAGRFYCYDTSGLLTYSILLHPFSYSVKIDLILLLIIDSLS